MNNSKIPAHTGRDFLCPKKHVRNAEEMLSAMVEFHDLLQNAVAISTSTDAETSHIQLFLKHFSRILDSSGYSLPDDEFIELAKNAAREMMLSQIAIEQGRIAIYSTVWGQA